MSSAKGQRRIPKSRVARVSKVVRLGTSLGTGLAGAAGRLVTGGSREEAAAGFHKKAAQALVETLGGMKGLPMKLGQMLSFVDDLIPAEHRDVYRTTLAKLQVNASPMRWSTMERVLRADLGAEPDEVFAEFDREPIAAASIGQVYRARTKDGRPVAVKVQYPGIADAIRSDLKNVELIRSALSIVLSRVDVEQTLEDIAARVLEECDYGCELCNQEEFAQVWRGDPEVWVPEAIGELSGERVLVSELIPGKSWQAMLEESSQAERDRLGRILFRFVFRSLNLHGMLNADPHPGNYLFPADGRMAFLDYGCVQRYDSEFVRKTAQVRRLVTAGEMGEPLREAAREVWGLPGDLDEEEWTFLKEYLGCVYEPLSTPGFQFNRDYTSRLADLTLKGKFLGIRKALRKGVREAKTPGLIYLARLQYGFTSVMAAMEAKGDWGALVAEIDAELDAKTATS